MNSKRQKEHNARLKKEQKERDAAERGDTKVMVVQAHSAGKIGGDYAKIMIDGNAVSVKKNASGHFRGIHIVVINP